MEHLAETSAWGYLSHHDASPVNCSNNDPLGASCFISQDQLGKRDLVAMVRGVVSLLSVLGSLSIIISAILKRQVFSPKVHPIFILSIADCLLSLLWMVGGGLWMFGGASHPDSERVVCFVVMLSTLIMELVVVYLTLIYALLAYSGIKQKDFNNVYLLFNRDRDVQMWKPWKIILAYVLAWLIPILLILIPFAILASSLHIIKHANSCSCWCIPYFGNVVPLAFPADMPTLMYLNRVGVIIQINGVLVGAHYLIGFILLFTIYWKILKQISLIRRNRLNSDCRSSTQFVYGATNQAMIRCGERDAKVRVLSFLTVFVVVGFFNMVLSFMFVFTEPNDWTKEQASPSRDDHTLPFWQLGIYLLQSATLPLQGFLNAIVYGWTRTDFLQVMAKNVEHSIQDFNSEQRHNNDEETLENSYSALISSGSFQASEETRTSVNSHLEIEHMHRQMSHDRSHFLFNNDTKPFNRNTSLLSPGPLDTVDEVTEPEDNEETW